MDARVDGLTIHYTCLVQLASIPLFDRLAPARSVLIAGAGGGFDVYAGLPLFFALRARGATVHLANLSFADLSAVDAHRPAASVVEVMAATKGPQYFPEALLARWLARHLDGESPPVYAFEQTGTRPLISAYETLCADLAVDAIVLVDGGTDSLTRGDEVGLGSPEADMASLAAVASLAVPNRALVSIGFGVDAFHGVCHAHILENIAAITRAGGSLGVFSLEATMTEFELYRSAVRDAGDAMPEQASIVHASIVAAVEGRFGDAHTTERTRASRLWIHPLMSLFFAFDLPTVASQVACLPLLARTDTLFDVSRVIESYQRGCASLRGWTAIPV